MKAIRHTIIRLPDLSRGVEQTMRGGRSSGRPRPAPGEVRRSGPSLSFDIPSSSSELVAKSAAGAMVLEQADMTPHEAEDMRHADGDVLVVPPMPLSVIPPASGGPQGALEDAPDASHTWGLEAVGALDCGFDGRKVKVAVLDTGIDLEHEAFARLVDEERVIARNFLSGREDAVDDRDGHGTHVAGTICGAEVGGVRIGVAPGVSRLIVAKVLGPGSSTEVLLPALFWAMEKGANVVSMSLGVDFPGRVKALVEDHDMPVEQATSMALENYRHTLEAFQKIADLLAFKQVLVVAATGNESARPAYTINEAPPAAAANILSVGALGRHAEGLAVAPFSNTGPELAGPGVAIRSAKVGGGLAARDGTSMAAPHVAGVAVLWRQHLHAAWGDALTTEVLKAKLIGAATMAPVQPESRRPVDIGSGLVQAPQA